MTSTGPSQRRRRLSRDGMTLVAGIGVTTVLGLVYQVVAQRLLGPVESAPFVTALAIVALFQLGLGPFNGTVARFTAQFAAQEQWNQIKSLIRRMARRITLFLIIAAVPVALLLIPARSWLRFDSVGPLAIAVVAVAGLLLLSIYRGALRGVRAFGSFCTNAIFEAGLRLVAGVLLLFWWSRADVALSAYLIAIVGVLLLSRRQIRRLPGEAHEDDAPPLALRRYFVWMLVFMLASAGYQNVDMLAVRRFFDDAVVGEYGAAFTLARAVSALATPFTTLLLPTIASLNAKGWNTKWTMLLIISQFIVLGGLFLLVVGFWAEPIVSLLFGEAFTAAGSLLFGVSLARLLGFLAHLILLAAVAVDDFRLLWVYVPGLVVQVILLAIYDESSAATVQALIIGHVIVLVGVAIGYFALPGVGRKTDADAQSG